ncbi:MarR family transcriptional regulator [Arthrobacter parietis]|uniref:MarR family transcriptional regulator n=1 Tax=Arthrobacter parietis TaxID=271434 RepID=A0ABP5MPY4_9MICC
MSHTSSTNPAAESPAHETASQGVGPAHRPPWTFLTNHGHVLITVASNPDMLVQDIAQTVGITPRGTLHILADLEEGGYIHRIKSGRRTHYTVEKHQHFLHPSIAHQEIGELLNFLAPIDGHFRKESP